MSKGKKDPKHKSWKDLSLKEKLSTVLVAGVALAAVTAMGGGYVADKLGDRHDTGLEDDITNISEQFAANREDVCSWDAAGLRVRDWKNEVTHITHDALDTLKPDAEGVIETLRRLATSYEPDKDIFRDKMQELADKGIGICFDNQLPPDMPSAYYPAHRLITLNPQAPDDQLARLLAFHFQRLTGPQQDTPGTAPIGLKTETNTATPRVEQAPANLPPPPLRTRGMSPA